MWREQFILDCSTSDPIDSGLRMSSYKFVCVALIALVSVAKASEGPLAYTEADEVLFQQFTKDFNKQYSSKVSLFNRRHKNLKY